MVCQKNFENYVVVNFEERPEMAACFDSLIVQDILEKISVLTATEIRSRKTLLFLDEIQECPRAILSLRYFYEKMPELHGVGAGSLVEMAFKIEAFRMPVGRVASIFMEPLSFSEFLDAMGHQRLREYLDNVEVTAGSVGCRELSPHMLTMHPPKKSKRCKP